MKENLIYKRPQLLFLFTTIIVILFCLVRPKATIDIQVHDTYFVMALWHYGIAISFICLLFYILYGAIQNLEITNLIKFFHVIVSSIFLVISSFFKAFLIYFHKNVYWSINKYLDILSQLFLLCQIILIIAIIFKVITKILK